MRLHRRPALDVVMGADGHLHVGAGRRIRVEVSSIRYAAAVIDDLCLVDDLPDGAALLDDCDALAHPILIVKPAWPIEPPNGTVEPMDRRAATAPGKFTGESDATGKPVLGTGEGSGSRICYNPADWPWQGDPASPPGCRVLLALLLQAKVNGQGADDPVDGRTCLTSES